MNCVRPRYMGMMSRFLVLSTFVVFRSFAVVASSVGMVFLRFLVVLGCLFRHGRISIAIAFWIYLEPCSDILISLL
jgi:hypothetical protein